MNARWDDFVVGIFLTNLCNSDVFLSNQNFILLFYITVIFTHFYNVFFTRFAKDCLCFELSLTRPPMASAISYTNMGF